MQICRYELRIAQGIGQEWKCAGADRFQNADAEKFVDGGADHQIGSGQEGGVLVRILGESPMHDLFLQPRFGLLKLLRHVAKVFSRHCYIEEKPRLL